MHILGRSTMGATGEEKKKQALDRKGKYKRVRQDFLFVKSKLMRRMARLNGFSALCALIAMLALTYFFFTSKKESVTEKKEQVSKWMSSKLRRPIPTGGGNSWRIMCFAMLQSEDDYNAASLVLEAWGNRCDRFMFFGWKDRVIHIPHQKVVNFDEQGPNKHGITAHRSWKFVYENFVEDYDFFMKAEVESYMFINNYRDYIERLHPDVPSYFGKQLKRRGKEGQTLVAKTSVSLSRSALQKLGPALAAAKSNNNDPPTANFCSEHYFDEQADADDVGLAACLSSIGIFSMDTSEPDGRERFMILHPGVVADVQSEKTVFPWYSEMSFNIKGAPECCSDSPISFHVNPLDLKQPIVKENDVWKLVKGH